MLDPDPVRLRPDPKLCISVLEVLLEIERNIEGNVSSTIGLILYDNAVHISTILNITYYKIMLFLMIYLTIPGKLGTLCSVTSGLFSSSSTCDRT